MLRFCALRREITANKQFFLFFLYAKCNFFEIILKSGIPCNVWPCSNFVLFNKCTFSFSSKHMIRNHTQPCVHDTKKKVGAIFSLIDKCIDHYLTWYCKCNIFVPRSYISLQIKAYLVSVIWDYLEKWIANAPKITCLSWARYLHNFIFVFTAISFYEHVNLMYGTVSEFCSKTGCSSMTGPANT